MLPRLGTTVKYAMDDTDKKSGFKIRIHPCPKLLTPAGGGVILPTVR
jgi:hypothetical protein